MRIIIEMIGLAVFATACIYLDYALWKKGEQYYYQERLARAGLWALFSWVCGSCGIICLFFLCMKILEAIGVR